MIPVPAVSSVTALKRDGLISNGLVRTTKFKVFILKERNLNYSMVIASRAEKVFSREWM